LQHLHCLVLVEGAAVVFHLAAMSRVAPSLKDPSMVRLVTLALS
jgi:hypothetical protein